MHTRAKVREAWQKLMIFSDSELLEITEPKQLIKHGKNASIFIRQNDKYTIISFLCFL